MSKMDRASIWTKTVDMHPWKPLSGDFKADVAVIGGGMAGILTAYFLQQAGLRVVVLEGRQIVSGQTKHTTAKVTSQHGLIYGRLLKQFGEEQARMYADANQWAIQAYASLIESKHISCTFTRCPAYLYTKADKEGLAQEFEAARRLGIDAEYCTDTELPFPVTAALRFSNQGRFHPLKFLKAVAESLEIYEDTLVGSVEGDLAHTDKGTVQAKVIVFATHYPFPNVPGYYFMRMHQERSYVVALENVPRMDGMYYGIDPDGLSFRPQENILLLSGGSHRTGENSAGGQYEKLRDAARKYWPESREIAAWSAQDCMTLDGVPYIGQFSASTPNWYVATGFEKWGMTSSMVSAKILSDLILYGKSPWEPLFTPQRFKPSASAKTLMEETAQATKGLARKWLTPSRGEFEALPNGHGGVVEVEGEKMGVYKDENGEAFVVPIRCPHLGCQLEWNPDEKSWDCPCHGSRFTYQGHLIDNPAQVGLWD